MGEETKDATGSYAQYIDAVKLILTGSTSKLEDADHQLILLNMLARGIRDDKGEKVSERCLPDVRTRQIKFIKETPDAVNEILKTGYYVPDLFKYMAGLFDQWDIPAPALAFKYLNRLFDDEVADEPNLKVLLRQVQIKHELAIIARTKHQNDPLKLEAQKRLSDDLNGELTKISLILVETSQQRKLRLEEWYQEECHLRGKHGALIRCADRECIARQTLSDILNRKK